MKDDVEALRRAKTAADEELRVARQLAADAETRFKQALRNANRADEALLRAELKAELAGGVIVGVLLWMMRP